MSCSFFVWLPRNKHSLKKEQSPSARRSRGYTSRRFYRVTCVRRNIMYERKTLAILLNEKIRVPIIFCIIVTCFRRRRRSLQSARSQKRYYKNTRVHKYLVYTPYITRLPVRSAKTIIIIHNITKLYTSIVSSR